MFAILNSIYSIAFIFMIIVGMTVLDAIIVSFIVLPVMVVTVVSTYDMLVKPDYSH